VQLQHCLRRLSGRLQADEHHCQTIQVAQVAGSMRARFPVDEIHVLAVPLEAQAAQIRRAGDAIHQINVDARVFELDVEFFNGDAVCHPAVQGVTEHRPGQRLGCFARAFKDQPPRTAAELGQKCAKCTIARPCVTLLAPRHLPMLLASSTDVPFTVTFDAPADHSMRTHGESSNVQPTTTWTSVSSSAGPHWVARVC
jgi:hypothetical protein